MASEAALADFIRTYIRTVWSLELLLLLRASPGRYWSPAELIKELRGSTSLVNGCLNHFLHSGLVVEDVGTWHLVLGDPELDELLNELARSYRERPITTLSLIREVDPVQSLADAFKITGDENG